MKRYWHDEVGFLLINKFFGWLSEHLREWADEESLIFILEAMDNLSQKSSIQTSGPSIVEMEATSETVTANMWSQGFRRVRYST